MQLDALQIALRWQF